VTRLPTLNARKIIQALERAGFVFDRQNGSHMIYFHPTRRLRTSVPKHSKDLNRNLMKLILKQAGLTEDQFRELL
jgi:predicted RNA binding protein YcfA (HicA-like mRNA interferase family)